MQEPNKLILNPSTDEDVANEFAGRNPGDEGSTMMRWRMESNEEDGIVLNILGIETDEVSPEEDSLLPPPEGSAIRTVLDNS